jgi:hypothetical protein
MGTTEVERAVRRVETEAERIFAWRYGELRRAGFEERLAYKLALRTDIDLHRATDLVGRGCPPRMVAENLL